MSNTWLVTVHHFKKNVLKKSFIFVLLSIPFFLGVMIVMIVMSVALEKNDAPLGYVDHSGLLADPLPAPENDSRASIPIIAFNSEQAARESLENEEIQAYFILSEDYRINRAAELVYYDQPSDEAWSDFIDFMQINLAADLQPQVRERMISGSNLIVRSPDKSREQPSGDPTMGMVLPVILCIAFIGLILFSAGYMLEGIADEKLNRTIEVIFTSLSPTQLITGKVLGIVGINFLQLATWIIVGIIAVFVAANVLDMSWFQNAELDWGAIFMVLGIGIPTYILAAALMLAVGSTVVQAQEGQAVGGIFYMLMISPLILIVVIGENPNGPAAITLSMLPFTSLLTTSIRNMLIEIPTWQIITSIIIQSVLAVGAIYLAVSAFRLGMLRYGKRLKLTELLNRKKTPSVEGRAS